MNCWDWKCYCADRNQFLFHVLLMLIYFSTVPFFSYIYMYYPFPPIVFSFIPLYWFYQLKLPTSDLKLSRFLSVFYYYMHLSVLFHGTFWCLCATYVLTPHCTHNLRIFIYVSLFFFALSHLFVRKFGK